MEKVPDSIWVNPIHFIACGFGAGAFPWAPGTVGTLVGVAFYFVLHHLAWWLYLAITIILFLWGVFICGRTNRDWGTQDHPAAVWDEIVGFLIVMVAVPSRWYWVVLGFLLFRLFDIWKPWPIRWVDRHVHGGWGVMLDDAIAAIFSWVLVQLAVGAATFSL
ncbi:MAG: phosphatidylglycerophosphatase [Gammaproteobacteria bacterium RIFCSPHIGHO2_12_FULL_41_15]|nr:MAG: phosphatidylglycerophosphatase [Gammaproteobacteria bacterium RIFCSPHIGHO2_12_FULL_41_15]